MKPITISGAGGRHRAFEPERAGTALQPAARGAGAAERNAGAPCATMLTPEAAVSAAPIHSELDARIRLRNGFGPLRGLVRRGESAERNNPDKRGRRCLRVPLAKQMLLLIPNFSTAPGELDLDAQLTTSSGELDMPISRYLGGAGTLLIVDSTLLAEA